MNAMRLILALMLPLIGGCASHAPAPVAEAFCASRLAPGHWGAAFGTLAANTDFATLLARAWPEAA